jgi:hypothetical protein
MIKRNWWWIYTYIWPLYKLAGWLKRETLTDAQAVNNMRSHLHERDRIWTNEYGWEPFDCRVIYNSPKPKCMTLVVTAHYGTQQIKVSRVYTQDARKKVLDLYFSRLKVSASKKLYQLEKPDDVAF